MTRRARDPAIRDAATIVVLRRMADGPAVLMGQRGAGAAFMPMKFVFPGGAVDASDAGLPLAPPPVPCAARLAEESDLAPATIAAAAIRELWEETGLILGRPGRWDPPPGWEGFAATGHVPDAGALRFIFRAITPRGRPRRFDARFFLVDAGAIAGDPDDFARAQDELDHLQWVPLAAARGFDLPFVTDLVLAEVAALADRPDPPPPVPFLRNDDVARTVPRLGA